jgi:hypothetical protein
MSTARLGRDREHRVAADLARCGWQLIMRAAASKGPADLLMAHPEHGAALVQVGSRTKTLGPDDRERLCTAAELCSSLALLAVVIPRQPIAYHVVDRGVPSRWARWSA